VLEFGLSWVLVAAAAPQATETAGPACARRTRARDPAGPLPGDRKSVLLRELGERVRASDAVLYGEGPARRLPAQLAALPKDAPLEKVFALRDRLADALLSVGDIEGALAQWEECRRLAHVARDPEALARVLRQMAVAWLRVAERRNCVAAHNPESCILPFSAAALHADRAGSEKALEVLEPIWSAGRDDLLAAWLANVAHMTLGTWPDGVFGRWRIPPEAFASERDVGRFPDVAARVGLDTCGLAGGSVMDDFDGDGRLDVLVSSSGMDEPLGLFLQQRDGTFADVADAAGLAGQLGGLNCFAADFDGDGRLDILVQRGAWIHRHGEIPNSLLIQQPDGTFVDRTLEAGIEIAAPSLVAAFADVDLDGDLDLFLGYESQGRGSEEDYPCRLFLNRGDATFEDVTGKAGVSNDRVCKGAAFGDYDGDRFPDLYVSNLGQKNRLYRNRGDGTFVDVAEQLGVAEPIQSFSCFLFDQDNDGWLDLYVSCYATPRTRPLEMTAWYRDRRPGADHQRLYRNDGKGGFRDVSREKGLVRVAFPMGSNFGDVDNDGFSDVYLATGDPDFSSLWPNVLLRNDAGRRFEDVTTSSGTGHLQKGHGVSFGDLDGDGDQDLFVEIGGILRDDVFTSALFQNPGHGNRWLTVRLIGRESDRFGIGARLRAVIEEAGARRDVFHFVGTNSSFGGNSLQAEMGLGKAERCVALEVFWPRTGRTQRFEEVPLDRVVVVDEGRDSLGLQAAEESANRGSDAERSRGKRAAASGEEAESEARAPREISTLDAPVERPRAGDAAAALAFLERARRCLAHSGVEEARSLLEQAIAADPACVGARVELGFLHVQDLEPCDWGAALLQFRTARALEPDHPVASGGEGAARAEVGDFDRAEPLLRAALDARGVVWPVAQRAIVTAALARTEAVRGRVGEALELYDEASRLPGLPARTRAAYRSRRAELFAEEGRAAESEAEVERTLLLDPENVRAHHLRARLLAKRGDAAGAARAARVHAILRELVDHTSKRHRLEPGRRAQLRRELVAAWPEYARGRIELARELIADGGYAEAVAALAEAIARDGATSALNALLAHAKAGAGDLDGAKAAADSIRYGDDEVRAGFLRSVLEDWRRGNPAVTEAQVEAKLAEWGAR
jgi:tetratricopeptide (TPR) repeat protein